MQRHIIPATYLSFSRAGPATMESALTLSVVIVPFAVLLWAKRLSKRSLPLPPGPKGYPIIGNSLDILLDAPWERFHDWSKVYGPCRFVSRLHYSLG